MLAGFAGVQLEDLSQVVDFDPVNFQVVVEVGVDLVVVLVVAGVLLLISEAQLAERFLHLVVVPLLQVVVPLHLMLVVVVQMAGNSDPVLLYENRW